MDLRALKYFVTAAEEMNMTRAAERLGMSQPPLSSQIKGLEQELGVQLFIRGKRRLQLTDAGALLFRRAKQILELSEQTELEMHSLEGLNGSINISLVEGRAPYLLARWIAGFRMEFPQVTFRLWNGDGDEAIERLQHGLADLALIAAPYSTEQLEGISVGREPWVAIISTKHPLAQDKSEFIPLKALAGEPLIVPSRHSRAIAIRNWFEEIGEEPNIGRTERRNLHLSPYHLYSKRTSGKEDYYREFPTDRVLPCEEPGPARHRAGAGIHQLCD